MPAKPVNLNDQFKHRIDENVERAHVIEIVAGPGDQTWHLTNSASNAALLNAGKDPMGYCVRLVVPEERDAFEKMLVDWDGMEGDILIDFINFCGELVAGVPTPPPSPSSATSRSRTSGTASRAT
jgi:hypothetical protein